GLGTRCRGLWARACASPARESNPCGRLMARLGSPEQAYSPVRMGAFLLFRNRATGKGGRPAFHKHPGRVWGCEPDVSSGYIPNLILLYTQDSFQFLKKCK